MKWLGGLFQRSKSKNVAVDRLYRRGKVDPRTEELLRLLPPMAEAIREGREYVYEKVLVDLIRDYDLRFGCDVAAQIDGTQKGALIEKLTGLMLFQFFNEMAERYPDPLLPSSLTDALHFEIYGALPGRGSFIDYLSYRNPHFENPQAAPAFKFGNDVAEILRTLDTSFSLMVAQQFPLIREVSQKLIRLVLFNEPIERPGAERAIEAGPAPP